MRDRLCSLVVRFPAADRGPGFYSQRNQIFWVAVGQERGPLSLVRINDELLERKVAVPVYKTEINDREVSAPLTTQHPSIHKSWY
jgi:hypothetical protein